MPCVTSSLTAENVFTQSGCTSREYTAKREGRAAVIFTRAAPSRQLLSGYGQEVTRHIIGKAESEQDRQPEESCERHDPRHLLMSITKMHEEERYKQSLGARDSDGDETTPRT